MPSLIRKIGLQAKMRLRAIGANPDRELGQVYEIRRKVGEGGFASVHRVAHKITCVRRAVKVTSIATSHADTAAFIAAVREAEMMHRVGEHRNVAQLIDVFSSKQDLFMVVELCYGSNLAEWLEARKGKAPTIAQAARLFREMALGVQHCHAQGVLHQDVKLENFVFHTNKRHRDIKLIDFGTAELMDNPSTTLLGYTDQYTPPELMRGRKSSAADVYSLGVCLFKLLTGGGWRVTLNEVSTRKMLANNCNDRSAANLCLRMLDLRPDQRPDLDKVLGHPFIHSYAQPGAAILLERKEKKAKVLRVAEMRRMCCLALMETLAGRPRHPILGGMTGRLGATLSDDHEVRVVQVVAHVILEEQETSEEHLAIDRLIKLDKGDVLMRRGAKTTEVFMVLAGSLNVHDCCGKKLCEAQAGTLACESPWLLGMSQPHTLTANAGTIIASVPARALQLIEKDVALRYLIERASKRDFAFRTVQFLRHSPSFQKIHPEILYAVANVLKPRFVRAGVEVTTTSAPNDHAVLVQEGLMLLLTGTFATINGPSFVFEGLALVLGRPRAFTLKCITDCELLSLSEPDFVNVCRQYPELLVAMRKIKRLGPEYDVVA